MTEVNLPMRRRFHRAQQIFGLLTALTGALGLAGWLADVTVLRSVRPGLTPMMPSTACGLILAGAALSLWRAEAGVWRQSAVRGAGGLIALLGLMALTLNRLNDEPRGLDRLLAPEWFAGAGPGWLAGSTALCFALAGAAFWLLDARRWWTRLGQWLALGAGVIAFGVLAGYLLGLGELIRQSAQSAMALHTALAFQFLSIGLLCARADTGIMSLMASPGPGGMMMRVLLPTLLLSRLALHGLIEAGARAGWYSHDWDDALFALFSMAVTITLVLLAASWLERIDRASQAANERFAQAFNLSPMALTISRVADGRLVEVNETFLRKTGYTRAEAIGRTPVELGLWIEPEKRERQRPQLLENRQLSDQEVRFRMKDGAEIICLVSASVIEFAGQPCVMSVVSDITERRQAEADTRFLLELSERIRLSQDAGELLAATARATGEHLQVSNCFFAESPRGADWFVIQRDYHTRAESLAGQYPVAAFGEQLVSDGLAGRAMIVHDTARDQRTAAHETAWRQLGIGAFMAVPLLRDGWFVAALNAAAPAARRWSEREIALLETVAERAWNAIEKLRLDAALRESEERYRTLFSSMDEGFCIIELIFDEHDKPVDYRFLLTNPAFEKHTGIRNAEGRTARELIPHEEYWFELFGRIALTGETARFEQASAALGRWFEVHAYRLGQPAERKVAVLFTDITERKRHAAVAERYRLLSSNSREVILFVRPDGSIIEANQAAVATYGYDREALLQMSIADLRAPETLPQLRAQLSQADREGLSFETLHRRRDGTTFPVEVSSTGADIGGERLLISIIRDITERKEAEEALRESERRYRSTFENAAVGIVHFGLDGSFLRVNERLCRLLGYTREELLKTNWMAISHPDEVQLNLALRERHLHGETEDYSLEKRYFRSDGSVIWVNLTASLLRDEQNEPLYFIAFIEDITVRKQLEAERERVLEQEREARQLAEEANRARDEWVAMVTHELRSPLNAMLGYARMLDQNPGILSPEVADIISIIKRNGERQRLLIDDLLDTARVISGKLRLEIRPLDLALVIREAIETVRPAAAARQIAITSQLDEQAGLITGDPDRLQQVVWNLLTNAVKFTLTGGSVHVELKRDDARARIIVTDTGAGIEPDFLPHVFERFSQQDTSRSRRYGGLGLGLALVKQIVELHGGTITAASAGAGAGAVFTVTLPLQMADFRWRNEETGKSFIPSHREDQSAIRHLQSAILKGVQALVIDDEADTRELVMTLLASQGAEIETAATTAAAWGLLTAPHRPQIVVCDIGMPGEDGYSLLRRLREWERERHLKPLPAIALTAHNSSSDRLQALLAGFQMHVAKPVEPEELITVIKSLLDRASLSDGARV